MNRHFHESWMWFVCSRIRNNCPLRVLINPGFLWGTNRCIVSPGPLHQWIMQHAPSHSTQGSVRRLHCRLPSVLLDSQCSPSLYIGHSSWQSFSGQTCCKGWLHGLSNEQAVCSLPLTRTQFDSEVTDGRGLVKKSACWFKDIDSDIFSAVKGVLVCEALLVSNCTCLKPFVPYSVACLSAFRFTRFFRPGWPNDSTIVM